MGNTDGIAAVRLAHSACSHHYSDSILRSFCLFISHSYTEAIPKSKLLDGFRHEYQAWNNCGPATLAIALSYWRWKGDQRLIADFIRPKSRDKNVMPYELADYVEKETEFEVIYRAGGEIELLGRFVAAGFPIMIEKGFEGRDFDGGWFAATLNWNEYNFSDLENIAAPAIPQPTKWNSCKPAYQARQPMIRMGISI